MATSLDSREGTLAIETVKNSLWNPETVTFEFTKVEMVNNDRLEAEVRMDEYKYMKQNY